MTGPRAYERNSRRTRNVDLVVWGVDVLQLTKFRLSAEAFPGSQGFF